MLTKLAIWYLRKRKKSVLIGFNIKDGEIQTKNKTTYYYDNQLTDVKIKRLNGEDFDFPYNAKFNIEYKD